MIPHEQELGKGDILLIGEISNRLGSVVSDLTQESYKVHNLPNGRHFLAVVESVKPDMILLCAALHNPDSYSICKKLKSLESTANIPVLFLNTQGANLNPVTVFQMGGSDYINSPFYTVELLSKIGTHVRLRQLTEQLAHKNLDMAEKKTEYFEKKTPIRELPNQDSEYFQEYLEQHWLRCARERIVSGDSHTSCVSLLFCKLDNEPEDAQQLQGIEQLLRQIVKRPADLVVQYQDKWAIAMPNTHYEGALKVAKFISLAVAEYCQQIGSVKPIKLSIGGATRVATQVLSSKILIVKAQEMLEQAQQQGGNQILFDEE